MSEVSYDDEERIRWSLLGFDDSQSIADIPQSRIEEANATWTRELRRKNSVLINPLKRRATRIAALCVFGLGCALTLAFSIKTAIARQNEAVGSQYAQSLTLFAIDLFNEDLSVTTDQATRAELLLPEAALWSSNSSVQHRMHACPQALQALTSIRMGFPQTGLKQLQNAAALIETEPLDNNAEQVRLELIFRLLAGKASLEAIQTMTSRNFLGVESLKVSPDLAEQSFDSLKLALKLLDSVAISGVNEDQRELLKAAIITDLARTTMKLPQSRYTESGKFNFILFRRDLNDYFDQANIHLTQVNARNPAWYGQKCRWLNNHILWETRKAQQNVFSAEEIEKTFNDFRSQIPELHQLTKDANVDSNEVHFELAICYSNLADALDVLRPQVPNFKNRETIADIVSLRNRAIDLLNGIPRIARSERHTENLLLNISRSIQIRLHQHYEENKFAPIPDQLKMDAYYLNQLLSNDLFNYQVGQFSYESRLATAIILEDQYSPETLQAYIDSLPPVLNEEDAKYRETRFSWLHEIIQHRLMLKKAGKE